MEGEMFSIGQTVRVKSKSESTGYDSASKACIALYNEDSHTYDVIYLSNDNAEESHVEASRIIGVEPFELLPLTRDAARAKEFGNILFSKKDYVEAESYYTRSHKLIQSEVLFSIGTKVIVDVNDSNSLQSGMVSSIDEEEGIEVVYDNSEYKDEETFKTTDNMIKLYPHKDGFELQRAVFMNLVRCCIKRGKKGWAIRWASFAIALLICWKDELPDSSFQKYMADALFIRASVLIAACRPCLAKKDAEKLTKYDKNRAALLSNEIKQFLSNRQKENKKLAKNIAEWLDVAMKSCNNSPQLIDDFLLPSDQADDA